MSSVRYLGASYHFASPQGFDSTHCEHTKNECVPRDGVMKWKGGNHGDLGWATVEVNREMWKSSMRETADVGMIYIRALDSNTMFYCVRFR
ncbi:hypothetical protein OSTOST_15134 [Ostertagia ostertagi]